MNFKKIQHLCLDRNITIADLEKKLGFGNGTINCWKEKTANPGVLKVKAVADFFGTTVDALLTEPKA